MPDRRTFLTATAAATAAALLPLEATALTCPVVVAGSVTNQSGTLDGWASAFADACGDRQGVDATPPFNSQWQYPLLLSDKAGVGGRYQANQVVKGERWLLLSLAAGRLDANPLPFPAADSGHTVATTWNDGAGNNYQWAATFATFSTTNCKQTAKAATGGTVTITACDATAVSGSYAGLTFQSLSGSLSGTFTAPRAAVAGLMTPEDYSGCPTRPSSQTCLNP
jgi:TAT (twin-arginine translocation) pathway signal sequence